MRAFWLITHPKTEGAKVVLTCGEHVLAVVHTYGPQKFMFPGGAKEPGEQGRATASREVSEELGVMPKDLVYIGTIHYDGEHKDDTIHVFHGELDSQETFFDPFEIRSVSWFHRSAVPELSPLSQKIYSLYENHARLA
ncbi:MAG: hypothetical protein AMXMBFR44_1360 [Candidatus Campbellbacteria bacterium]